MIKYLIICILICCNFIYPEDPDKITTTKELIKNLEGPDREVAAYELFYNTKKNELRKNAENIIYALKSKYRNIITFLQKIIIFRLGEEIVPLLLKIVKDENQNKKIRYEILEILSYPFSKNQNIIPTLKYLYEKKNGNLNKEKIQIAMVSLGGKSVPIFIENAKHDNWKMRKLSIEALEFFSEKQNIDLVGIIQCLINGFKDKNDKVRKCAIVSLSSYGERTIPFLKKEWEKNDVKIQRKILTCLNFSGRRALRIIPYLKKLLKNKKQFYRKELEDTLLRIKYDIPPYEETSEYLTTERKRKTEEFENSSIKKLINELQGKNKDIAVEVLLYFKNKKELQDELESLVYALNQKDQVLQYQLKRIIERIGEEAIPILIQLLKDKRNDIQIQYKILNLLAFFKTKALSAIPYLTYLYENGNLNIEHLSHTLMCISNKSIPIFIKNLNNDNWKYRINSLETLSYFLRKEALSFHSGIPLLIDMLQDKNIEVRKAAIYSLKSIGLKVIPFLMDAIKKKNMLIKKGCLKTIQLYNEKAIFITDDLEKLLKYKYHPLRNLIRDTILNVKESKILRAEEFQIIFPEYVKEISVKTLIQKCNSDTCMVATYFLLHIKSKNEIFENLDHLLHYLKLAKGEKTIFPIQNAIAKIGKKILPNLIKILKDNNDERFKYRVLKIIEYLPIKAISVIPILANLFEFSNLNKEKIKDAMITIGPETIPIFIKNMNNKNKQIRILSIEAIAFFYPEQIPHFSDTINIMINMLNEKDLKIRNRIAFSIYKLGKITKPYLLNALKNKSIQKECLKILKLLK